MRLLSGSLRRAALTLGGLALGALALGALVAAALAFLSNHAQFAVWLLVPFFLVRALGLSPTAHAVELFRQRLAARGVIPIAEAGKRRDRSRLRLAGLAVSIQHPMTAKNFVFIALEDETGMINVTVRPQVYAAHRAILHRHPLLVIDGTLQVEGEVLNVVATRLHPVDAVIAEDERETRLPLSKQQRLFR